MAADTNKKKARACNKHAATSSFSRADALMTRERWQSDKKKLAFRTRALARNSLPEMRF